MPLEFGTTNESINTQYAPLAALIAHYKQNQVLEPLKQVAVEMKTCDFKPQDKLEQVLVSILAGCPTLSESNSKLKSEIGLAQVGQWPRIADQSVLSRTLDALTLMNIGQLRDGTTTIWHHLGQTLRHDWRGFLWLDFDLSGLPCGKQAEESQKGYFSGKKTSLDASWRGSAPSDTGKRSGPISLLAINIRSVAFNQRC